MNSEKYDVVIGLEIHIQSKTKSKMFCSCSTDYFHKDPNSLVCPVCLGLPGALPVPNKKAIENCIKLGLAVHSDPSSDLRFDRKHYFYPDLPKGYQISQYDMPLIAGGSLAIFDNEGIPTIIEIERIHQEEDVAKSFHEKDKDGNEYSLIDYNKSGVPLIELVTKPVIRSASEAKNFATAIRHLVRWLEISDADMEKGQMRCEPNISVQEKGKYKIEGGKVLAIGDYQLNPKVEVKNIGSISAVEKSINYEVNRMIEELENGNKLKQQTRGWDAVNNVTIFQRLKENAQDYRYFPEPDIPLIKIEKADVARLNDEIDIDGIPEEYYFRYINEYKLSKYDAYVLIAEKRKVKYFEKALKLIGKENAKELANWMTGLLFSLSNELEIELSELGVSPEQLVKLIKSVRSKKVILSKAKELLTIAVKEKKNLDELLNDLGEVVTDNSKIEEIVKKVIENNPKPVQDYKSGKETVIMFLVGQVMKETKGMVNPTDAKEILTKLLK